MDYTQQLNDINQHLANLELILKDMFYGFNTFIFVSCGLVLGMVGMYIILEEIMKKW